MVSNLETELFNNLIFGRQLELINMPVLFGKNCEREFVSYMELHNKEGTDRFKLGLR